jgi:maleate cis-trans isomerase
MVYEKILIIKPYSKEYAEVEALKLADDGISEITWLFNCSRDTVLKGIHYDKTQHAETKNNV